MRIVALLIGFILLAAGIACFVPGLLADGTLFGLFPVNTPLAIAFIVTGIAGIMIGITRRRGLEPMRGPGRDLRDLGM